MDSLLLKPGTVLAVRTTGEFAKLIQLGSALIDETSAQNHIVVLDHYDSSAKIWWGIEGRPGGVGWRDCTAYLSNPYTISNYRQPLTRDQQDAICFGMRALLGAGYDWAAIIGDAERDLYLPVMPDAGWKEGETPMHVVCSSVAAYEYGKCGASYPREVDEAHIQPADWVRFIIENSFN